LRGILDAAVGAEEPEGASIPSPPPSAAAPAPVLEVAGVSVRFGGVQALDRVSLTVRGSAITGLIGPNGAGKTTLFNVITGLEKPGAGRVAVAGRDVGHLPPYRRARLGLARTFQRLEIFGSLTVWENVLTGAEFSAKAAGRRGDPGRTAAQVLETVGLTSVASSRVDTLPTGMARLVELGRAIAAEPKLLLLDEPSSGLDEYETETFAGILSSIAGRGTAILLVEHDIDLVMALCSDIYVLDFGRMVAHGGPEQIRDDPDVQKAYLGVATPAAAGGRAGPLAPPSVVPGEAERAVRVRFTEGLTETAALPAALELLEVHAGYGGITALHGVTLTVEPGQVYGLLGPNGAGKSTLLKVASGHVTPDDGCVHLGGVHVNEAPPSDLARAGVCLIPEGRGIFPNLTVAENLLMYGYAAGRSIKEMEDAAFGRFPRLADRRTQLAGTLSGGEQQMLAMSRTLISEPVLLLLDEISMGLAPLVVSDLYSFVDSLASTGITIVLTEQFAEAALAVVDRAAVMAQGRIVATGPPAQIRSVVSEVYLGGRA
jgi:branched-chain amino acid transport system ATP-binding protein